MHVRTTDSLPASFSPLPRPIAIPDPAERKSMPRSALQPWISSAIAPRILLAVGLVVDPAIEDPDTGLT
jgi:hypothetical protein